MKSKILKIVLPALALMLAITASFAFNSTKTNIEGVTFIGASYKSPGLICTRLSYPVNCQYTDSSQPICTRTIPGYGSKWLYVDYSCGILLYEQAP